MPVTAKEPLYRVEPPYSAHQIEQIKWAYNQGYVFGILASYGIFLELNYQKNFSLPVIRSAWENGYIDGVAHVSKVENKNSTANK